MTVSLQSKANKWYAVLNWTQDGKRKQKWINTKITTDKGNKRKAQARAKEILAENESRLSMPGGDKLFSEYMQEWLEHKRQSIAPNTFVGYVYVVNHVIVPYFSPKKIKLYDLKPYHLQEFYSSRLKDGVTGNTIKHYHANIMSALKYAVKLEYISSNPAERVELPKVDRFQGTFLNAQELKQLLQAVSGSPLETPVNIAIWLGLRRGEILGLKWECIDFQRATLSVTGTLQCKGDKATNLSNIRYEPTAKTSSSFRTLPLAQWQVDYLQSCRDAQQRRQKKDPDYNHKWDAFVCVQENGDIVPLDHLSRKVPKIAEKCGLPKIRFHDLRHSAISMLLNNGVDMKIAQEIAGHSSYSTTANIYAHILADNKRAAIDKIAPLLEIG